MDIDISEIAALVGDPTRSRMLLALMDGMALPAGELAFQSCVSPQTASAHLAKMVRARLLKLEVQGKHHYYRLSGPKIASLLECLSTIAPIPNSVLRAETPRTRALRFARSCYSHLAGEVAVELNVSGQKMGLWRALPDKRYKVSRKGVEWLKELGIHRPHSPWHEAFARACLDWRERRHHVGGELGNLLLTRFLELKWLERAGDSRSIRLTHKGRLELNARLSLHLRLPEG
jgi:DNA-binding transcriptional ArsR family regulator